MGEDNGLYKARLELPGKFFVHVKTVLKTSPALSMYVVLACPTGERIRMEAYTSQFRTATRWAVREADWWKRDRGLT